MNDKSSKDFAKKVRTEIINMLACAGSGHPGGSLSCADIVAVLYNNIMRYDFNRPNWEDRDRFIISKGHSCPAVYAALALKGFIPMDELKGFRQNGSILGGHPNMNKVPGIDMTTGSLGHGISAGVGMALAGKIDKKDYKVFVIIGDGESQEGQVWEAAMAAAHFKLDNLVVITDKNNLQIDGTTMDIMNNRDLSGKWQKFGWSVLQTDGHDHEKLNDIFSKVPFEKGLPNMIIADTVKGKGVSFMEDRVEWHGKSLSGNLIQQALKDIEGGTW